jgi:hypothetical protein
MIKTISESDVIKITRKDLRDRDIKNQKQGAIKELSAVVLLIDAIMDIDDMQGLKNTIQKWITDLEEGVEHE